jgi:hypothetical protein
VARWLLDQGGATNGWGACGQTALGRASCHGDSLVVRLVVGVGVVVMMVMMMVMVVVMVVVLVTLTLLPLLMVMMVVVSLTLTLSRTRRGGCGTRSTRAFCATWPTASAPPMPPAIPTTRTAPQHRLKGFRAFGRGRGGDEGVCTSTHPGRPRASESMSILV